MGIEGGSNNEVQFQEINQQTNEEQLEINQAEHQKNGEELDNNSLIEDLEDSNDVDESDDASESDFEDLDSDNQIEDNPKDEVESENLENSNDVDEWDDASESDFEDLDSDDQIEDDLKDDTESDNLENSNDVDEWDDASESDFEDLDSDNQIEDNPKDEVESENLENSNDVDEWDDASESDFEDLDSDDQIEDDLKDDTESDNLENSNDVDEWDDASESDFEDLDSDAKDLDSDDTADSVEEDDNNGQVPLDLEDSMEDDGDELENPEGEDTDNSKYNNESEKLEDLVAKDTNDSNESENPEDKLKDENLENESKGDSPNGGEAKEIDKPLIDRLNEIHDKYYDAADEYGVDDYGNSCAILSLEQKENMVNELKQEYDNTPKEDRGNTFVPESPDYLKDGAISRAETADGNHSSWVNYEWPDNDGFKTENDMDGNPIVDRQETTMHKGDVVDRVGHNSGRFTSPVENGEPGSVESRALPYHFTESNIENEPSYHQFRAKDDITPENIQDKINNVSDPVKQKSLQREFDKGDGKTYEGEIGHAFADGDGGGTQYHMPMSIQSLIDLDLLEVL